MSKKVSYMTLLKEAISDAEHDTSKPVDIKGPMLDPILSYSGGGELPTQKDAASILERYYFNEDADLGVTVEADEPEKDEKEKEEKVEEKMAGDVQGDVKGLAASDNEVDAVPGKDPGATKKDIEDEIKEELAAVSEQDDEAAEEDVEDAAKVSTEIEALENSVIEKLIAEMEGEEEEEMEEANRVAGDRGAQGEEAMGTGNDDDQVPSRKDSTNEQDDAKPFAGKETPEEEKAEKEAIKDRDAAMKESDAGVGPGPMKAGKGKLGEDEEGGVGQDPMEEAFKIFKEEIEEDDVVDVKSGEVQA
jgi:hypothetical protein